MTTLSEALALAQKRWDGGPGGKVMGSMASACVAILGGPLKVETLQPPSGTLLLAGLQRRGLSPKSVRTYYGAFKRMLALQGYACTGWPSAPVPPRVKSREPIQDADLSNLIVWFEGNGFQETADLARLMRETGGRVNREVLRNDGSMEVIATAKNYDTLRITGKGGHERVVPVMDPEVRELLADKARLERMTAVRYKAHLYRWSKGVAAVGIKSRLATPHAVRHSYATDTHRKSGGNLSLVQELLGHASPATTAGYVEVDMEAKVRARRL